MQINTVRQEPWSTTASWYLFLDFLSRVEAHKSLFIGTVAGLGGDKLCMDWVQAPGKKSPCRVRGDMDGGAHLVVVRRSLKDPNNVASPAQ